MIFGIPPRDVPGKDFVAFWEDFLTDNDINRILAEPEWILSVNATIMDNDTGTLDKNIRRSKISWLNLKNSNADIWQKITWAVSEVNRQYFQFELSGCYEPFQLGCYTAEEKDHYKWHTDMAPGANGVPRKLSMSLLLSDPSEFQGGDLEVMTGSDNIQKLELKKGRAWFFPSWVLHRVTPVTNGTRRSLVCWVGGPPFR
jgi:PKHD-type hydroxylase